jgi:Family of unknown function (DUF5703)
MAQYSYLMLYLPRGTSRDAARRILTDHAEYGNWELSRLRLYPDGSRKATLRRLIIRQARTQLGIAQWPPARRGELRHDSQGKAGRPAADYLVEPADQPGRPEPGSGPVAG